MDIKEVFWKNYIRKCIISNVIDEKYIDWGVNAIWSIYSNEKFGMTPDEIFRGLIYINKDHILGCFAFKFTDKVLDAIESQKIKDLYEALKSETPEYTSDLLTEQEKKDIKKFIDTQKIILNRYMEGCTSSNNLLNNLCQNEIKQEEYFNKCINDVLNGSKIDLNSELESNNCNIWVSDYNISFNYKLSELLTRIYNNDPNYYTEEQFSETLKSSLNEKYPLYFKFIKTYQETLNKKI